MLFCKNDTQDGAVSSKYCDQLKKIFEKHSDTVEMHVNKASAHGWRKGSATTVSSGTTLPPPISSIATRGD